MKIAASLLLLLAAAVASGPAPAASDPVTGIDSQTTVDYLLDNAAADFRKHGPDPAAFRNVRFGKIEAEGEDTLLLVCGEVQPASGKQQGKWVEFATLRTSGYEQWLGSAGYCSRPGTTWEAKDLSAELQRRVDALR